MYQEKVFINSNEVDSHFDLKISSIFKYLQQVSTNHAEILGVGKKDTWDKGIYWVITRMKVVIHKMPKMLETLTVTTHPGETMLFMFPRFYEIYNEKGELVISASSSWALLDRKEHKIVTKHGFNIPKEKDDNDLPLPEKITAKDISLVEKRKVRYSDIDLNGHLNNTKYIDYILDTHDLSFYDKKQVSEIVINYEKEVKDGDEVSLYSDNNFPEIIVGETNSSRSFTAIINFKDR